MEEIYLYVILKVQKKRTTDFRDKVCSFFIIHNKPSEL